MSTYMDVNRVTYSSPDVQLPAPEALPPTSEEGGVVKKIDRGRMTIATGPLCKLYFCRHCLKLRSTTCVSHEVESYYCPNCLEGMSNAEAKVKKHRCGSCFDCPSCHHILSTRATSLPSGELDADGRPVARKSFYLACGFCRWTSRDVGIKDQSVASGGWKDQENIHEKRIQALLEYYKQVASREKAETEKKKLTRRKGFYQLSIDETSGTDKYGLGAGYARKRTGLMSSLSRDMDEMKIQEIGRSATVDSFDELPDNFYTQTVSLAHVTTISQRHANPEFQPVSVTELYPRHKQLLIKRSLRCKQCDHNLCKPEYSPTSIKFKILLSATLHIPEIRIQSLPVTPLTLNVPTRVVLTLFNPLDFLCHVTLLPCDPEGDNWSTARVELPVSELLLSRCDESVEFDDSMTEQQSFEDDQNVVAFRKANKIGFYVTVTPTIADGNDVKIRFRMKHDYQTMASALAAAAAAEKETKEPEFIWLEHIVSLNLGPAKSG